MEPAEQGPCRSTLFAPKGRTGRWCPRTTNDTNPCTRLDHSPVSQPDRGDDQHRPLSTGSSSAWDQAVRTSPATCAAPGSWVLDQDRRRPGWWRMPLLSARAVEGRDPRRPPARRGPPDPWCRRPRRPSLPDSEASRSTLSVPKRRDDQNDAVADVDEFASPRAAPSCVGHEPDRRCGRRQGRQPPLPGDACHRRGDPDNHHGATDPRFTGTTVSDDHQAIKAADKLLPLELPEASDLLAAVFPHQGIDLRQSVNGDQRVVQRQISIVSLADGHEVVAEQLLVATEPARIDLARIRRRTASRQGRPSPGSSRSTTSPGDRRGVRPVGTGKFIDHGAFHPLHHAPVEGRDRRHSSPPRRPRRLPGAATAERPPTQGAAGRPHHPGHHDAGHRRRRRAPPPSAPAAPPSREKTGNKGIVQLVADRRRHVLVSAT